MPVAEKDAIADAVPLLEASAWLPRQVSGATLHRWATTGCKGVVLQTRRIGGRLFVRRAWMDEFIEALNKRG